MLNIKNVVRNVMYSIVPFKAGNSSRFYQHVEALHQHS